MEKQWKQWHFIFLSSKITADFDWSHEIKRCSLLGRKAMTNLDSMLKIRDVTLPTKVHSQRYGFSSSYVRMWEMDNKKGWALKNWCLWPVVLENTLESPWIARRSNQPILKEINPKYWKDWCGSWNSDTLATWCKELTHSKRSWYWERLKAGGEEDYRG